MEYKKLIDIATKISICLLLVAGILSLFDIGYTLNPLYSSIPAKMQGLFIGFVLLTSSSTIGVYLIYLVLNDKLDCIYKPTIALLVVTIVSNIFLGGNILFISTAITSIIMLTINYLVKEDKLHISHNKTVHTRKPSRQNSPYIRTRVMNRYDNL